MQIIFSMLFLLLSAHVQAAEHAHHGGVMHQPGMWTSQPLLKMKTSGESRERRIVMVVPQNIVADGVAAHSNNLTDEHGQRQLPLEMAGARLDRPATGGFHWLAAREESDETVRVASTVYYFGERGANNPTAIFMRQKHELELIPLPYPREHSRYRANEAWRFLVRFNGQPLPDRKVVLETSNGSRSELISDTQGIVVASIPDDFKAEVEGKEGGHGRPGADFVLAAEHAEGGKNYLTAFNAAYGKSAFDQRSIVMGLGFTLLGMLGAMPLLRHRKTKKNDAPEKEEGELTC